MAKPRKKMKSTDKNKGLNKAALIIAVFLTALVIFYARGGFGAIGKLLSKAQTAKTPQYTVTAVRLF